MSSKECSDSDEAGELKDLHLGDADSCEVLASFIEEDQQSIKSKGSEQQWSNIADKFQSTSSVHQNMKNRKLQNLNISKVTANRQNQEIKLYGWTKKPLISKASKKTKDRITNRKVKPSFKVKQLGRIQTTFGKETTFSLLDSKQS